MGRSRSNPSPLERIFFHSILFFSSLSLLTQSHADINIFTLSLTLCNLFTHATYCLTGAGRAAVSSSNILIDYGVDCRNGRYIFCPSPTCFRETSGCAVSEPKECAAARLIAGTDRDWCVEGSKFK